MAATSACVTGTLCSTLCKNLPGQKGLSGMCRKLRTLGISSFSSLSSARSQTSHQFTQGIFTAVPNRLYSVGTQSQLKSTRRSGDAKPEWSLLKSTSLTKDLSVKVNEKLDSPDVGRLFAVVQVGGKQRKVTPEDIIIVEHNFPPVTGDRIRLEKVLMVGSKDFTLIGQPILSRDQVSIEATVVEKTLSHHKVLFNYIRRKGFRRFRLNRTSYTMVVINSIRVNKIPLS